MSVELSEITPYKRLPDSDLKELLRSFETAIDDFIRYTLGYGESIEYTVCALDIIDAIIRVDRRSHYYQAFHGMYINDCKKAALYAYWIVKFRPIKIIDDEHRNKLGYNSSVNELFAIHYLLAALSGTKKIALKGEQGGIELSLEDPYIEELRYSLRFRSFTIDAMLVLADTITTETFTGYSTTAVSGGLSGLP